MSTKEKSVFLSDPGCDPSLWEVYRLLRTSIKFLSDSRPLKTILITSSGPGEGKSTVTCNLGVSLARDGASVLLVDTDLRAPVLHRNLQVKNVSGLTDAIREIYGAEVVVGNVKEKGMGDLLQLIRFQEKTGCLKVEGDGQIFRLWFERGKMTDAVWENRPDEKKLGSILVDDGKITENQLTEALKKQGKSPHALGSILVRLGYIGSQEVETILKSHLSESIDKVFKLDEATYAFEESRSPKGNRGDSIHREMRAFLSGEVAERVQYEQPFIEEKINAYLKETKMKNLMVMTSGSPTTHPSESLGSEKMKSMVAVLSTRFDFILFDSPPVGLTADASILASFLDGVLFVVQAGRLNARTIQQARAELGKVEANMVGVVLNQFDMKKENYYGYYHREDHEGEGK